MTISAVIAIKRAEIHLPNRIQHSPNQMVLRHPLARRRRHQKHLITIKADEVHSHDRMLLTEPDSTALFPTATQESGTLPGRTRHPPSSGHKPVALLPRHPQCEHPASGPHGAVGGFDVGRATLLPVKESRKKPDYPFDVGAYSTPPRTERQEDGTYVAQGSIQSWRGSLEDLARAADDATTALSEEAEGTATLRISITDWQGRQHEYDSSQSLVTAAPETNAEQLTTARVELSGAGGTHGTVVARRTMPGVVISVVGRSRIQVDGLARLLFRGLMRGYVDRYGGIWRPTAAFATTLVPAALTFGVFTERDGHWPDWARGVLLLAGLTLTFAVMVNSWQWTLVRTPLEFVPDDAQSEEDLRRRITAVLRRPRVAKAVALVGVIAVGILSNKLSDVIPWP